MLKSLKSNVLAILGAASLMTAVGAFEQPAHAAAMANPAAPGTGIAPTYLPNDPRIMYGPFGIGAGPMGYRAAIQAQMDQQRRASFLGYVMAMNGKYVDSSPGRHECADFAIVALRSLGMIPGNTSSRDGHYTWGRPLNLTSERILPGDIIQLVNVKLSYKTATSWGSWETTTQHTAIVIGTEGNGLKLKVMQQNAPYGSPVNMGYIDLNWKVERGDYTVFRPYVPVMA